MVNYGQLQRQYIAGRSAAGQNHVHAPGREAPHRSGSSDAAGPCHSMNKIGVDHSRYLWNAFRRCKW